MPNSSEDKTYRIQDIGNTLKLRQTIDPGFKVTNWFRQGLNIVDLFPAAYKIDLTSKHPSFRVYNRGQDLSLGFKDPTEKFRNRCIAYGLDKTNTGQPAPTALRLWVTGESTFQEEFGTSYSTNLIESGLNGLVSKISPLIRTAQKGSAAVGSKLGQAVVGKLTSVIDQAAGALTSVGTKDKPLTSAEKAGNNIVTGLGGVAKLLLNNAAQFSYISMPKTYSGSSYSPALNFNVRLISPYGHPDAIQKFIVEPLTYMLLLTSPTTTDGITYGGASYVTVKAYGITDMILATIDNISIRRGGNDTAYNKFRQPLSVDINVSIKPASEGFAAFMHDNTDSSLLMNTREFRYPDGVKNVASLPNPDFRYNKDGTLSPNAAVDINGNGVHSAMTTVGSILESFRPQSLADSKNAQAAANLTTSPPSYAKVPNTNQQIHKQLNPYNENRWKAKKHANLLMTKKK